MRLHPFAHSYGAYGLWQKKMMVGDYACILKFAIMAIF